MVTGGDSTKTRQLPRSVLGCFPGTHLVRAKQNTKVDKALMQYRPHIDQGGGGGGGLIVKAKGKDDLDTIYSL